MSVPFITAPYVARVLGADGVGIYSYTSSIQMYFSMFAALGTVSYGTREIARYREDNTERSVLFWNIELLTIVTTISCMGIWIIWIFISNDYRIYYLVLTLNLAAVAFDISWFYKGLEQFKYIVVQNLFFKILGIVMLFAFVREKDDLVVYIAIMSLVTLLGNASMWIYLPKFLKRISFQDIHLFIHFKETLIYFVPTVASSVYTILDKTLIGAITEDMNENGYYESATKIINMANAITFTALNSVLGSRISYLFSVNKFDEIKVRIVESIDYILFMGIGICFGLISIADKFVPVFFGTGYDKVIFLIKILSPIVVIIGISNCLGAQYYTPAGLKKKSAKFIIIGAVLNLFLNLILIPGLRSYGAVIASLMAESVITVLYLIYCNGFLTVGNLKEKAWKKVISGLVMYMGIYLTDFVWINDFWAIVLGIFEGVVIYIVTLLLMRDSFVIKMIQQGKKLISCKTE